MSLDHATCYRALVAHDPRFDGVFYVAVTSTGIYCRPICPARVPASSRCVFYRRAAEAERAGYRACFRCRPELAPGVASVDAVGTLAESAARKIDAGYLDEGSVDALAEEFGVTARHLRRAMESELGVTPIELAQTKRLALAKHLLQETDLPLAQVAFASGFSSVRRFNASFRARFERPPTALRREHGDRASSQGRDTFGLRLDYRPPLAWDSLLAFLGDRCVAGVERVVDGAYERSVSIGDRVGRIRVRPEPGRDALRADVSVSLAPVLAEVVVRLRALFDLDAQPTVIAEHLGRDPLLARSVHALPGLRLPGAFDPFEMAIRAILGQQVSVAAATTVCGRLVARFGTPPESSGPSAEGRGSFGWRFPSPERLASASVEDVATLGMPGARARTILAFASAMSRGEVSLAIGTSPAAAIDALVALPGIGPWTAHYVAMRALRHPDAFPASDLGVRKGLAVTTTKAAEERAEAFRPWRGYAVMHLWTSLAHGG